MKNFNSFFNQLTAMPKRLAMVLTVLFTLGVGSMLGAEGDTHDFSQSLSQLLNNNATISSITIAEQSYAVKEVKVTCGYNKTAGGVTMTVSVGGTSWGNQTHNKNATSTYSFTGTATTGSVVISFKNNCGSGTGKGTFKVSNVQLVEGASAPATPYTVTFHTTATTEEKIDEASAGAGVTPPTMEEECGEWEFQGWSESSSNSETSTTPLSLVTLTSGKYYPTEDIDLYPVYTKTTSTGGTAFDEYTQVALGGTVTSGKYLISTGLYTMAGNEKTGASFSPGTTEKTAYEYTVTVDGSYFTILGPDGKYVGGNDGTSLAFGTTVANDSYRWKYVNSGIQNKSYTTRHIKAYNTTDFRHYATSNGTLTYLYKRTEKSSGATYYYSYPQCATETAITLHANDGTNDKTYITTGEKTYTVPPCSFSRTGYNFVKWNTQEDGKGTDYAVGSTINLDGTAVNLYAIWTPITYTITYELDGGTNHASNPANYTIETSTITLQAPNKDGHTFGGWYKESTFENEVTLIAKGSTGNITLYAKWEEIPTTCTITYDANGGTGTAPTDNTEYSNGATVMVVGNYGKLTKDGYAFIGWNTATDGTGTPYKKGDTFTITGNTTLYAQWCSAHWVLVTNKSEIEDDTRIIIAAKDYNVALSTTQNTNNRGQIEITKNYNTVTLNANVQTLSLVGLANNQFALYTGSGYLYAASSSYNYLKTGSNTNGNGNWEVTISQGVASVFARGTNTNNQLKYNSTSSLFSCYGSGNSQKDVVIYKEVCKQDSYNVTSNPTNATAANANAKTVLATAKSLTLNYTANTGYLLPETIIVKMGGVALVSGTDYTWNKENGSLTINVTGFYGDIDVTIVAEEDPCYGFAMSTVTATSTINSITLTWTEVAGATGYKVRLDEGEFTTATGLTHTFEGLSPKTTYNWEVQAVKDGANFHCEASQTGSTTTQKESFTVSWVVNGNTENPVLTESVVDGAKITKYPSTDPSAPSGCSTKVFVGWTNQPILTPTNDEPILYTKLSDVPVITDNTTLHAVWADETLVPGEDILATETINCADLGYSNGDEVTTVEGEAFTINWNKGTNSNVPKYYTTGPGIRAYGGNYFTISSENTITAVALTFGTGDGTNAITTDLGTYSAGSWSGSSNSITFTIGGSSGHRRIATIAVTYTTQGPDEIAYSAYTTLCDECTPSTLSISADKTTENLGVDGKAIVTFTPTSGNGGAITYFSNPSSSVTWNGAVATFNKAGTYTIFASQDKNGDNCPTISNEVEITITATPVLYFTTEPANPIVFESVECGGNTTLANKKSVELQGYNLSGDVTVTVVGDYKIAKTSTATLAEYSTTLTLAKTDAGKINGNYDVVYILSCPPAGGTAATEGTLTFTTTNGNKLTVNLSTPTVTCTPHTLTFSDRGNAHSKTEYYAGDEVSQPEDPSGVCTDPINYVFDGWAEATIVNGSTEYTKVTFPYTMPGQNKTLYAVYRYVDGNVSVDKFMSVDKEIGELETGKDYVLTGYYETDAMEYALSITEYEDGKYKTKKVDVQESSVKYDDGSPYYEFETADNEIIWTIVGDDTKGYTFQNKSNNKYLNINGNNLVLGDENDHMFTIEHETDVVDEQEVYYMSLLVRPKDNNSQYLSSYYKSNASQVLFNLHTGNTLDLYLYKRAVSYLYTTSPVCGPYVEITSSKDIYVTGGNAGGTHDLVVARQKVAYQATRLEKDKSTGNLPSIKVLPSNITYDADKTKAVTITFDEDSVRTLQPDGTYTISGTMTISYQPKAHNVTDDIQVVLNANYNPSADVSNASFTIHARSLPQEFVIVAKQGDKWYALNGDMSNGSSANPANGHVVVDDETEPTKATYAPCNTIYTFDGLPNTGDRKFVRFQGTDGAWLWAASGTNVGIQNKSLKNTPSGNMEESKPYNWEIETENNITYFFHNANSSRVLRLNDGKFGMYVSGTDVIRILPYEAKCLYNYAPSNLKVSELKSTYVTLVWDAVAGATRYQYSNDATNWTDAGSEPTVTINGLTSETNYTYYIRAYHADAGVSQECFDYSEITFTTADCDDVPTDITYTADLNSITVSWTASAASATIKLYSDENGEHSFFTQTSATSPWKISSLTKNTTYYLQIFSNGTCASPIIPVNTEDIKVDVVEWQPQGIVVDINTNERVGVTLENEVSYGSGTGSEATELFFSKYYEATGNVKLVAIYNGTKNIIDLTDYEIHYGKDSWESQHITLNDFGETKGQIQPGEELILYTTNESDDDNKILDCVNKEYPDGKWVRVTQTNNDGKGHLSFAGNKTLVLKKDGVVIDVIGALTSAGNPTSTKAKDTPSWGDAAGWNCATGLSIADDTQIGISTNRCLLIRNNTVTSGANAVTSNIDDFVTLCSEWKGAQVPDNNVDNGVAASCENFAYVGTFDYSDYYTKYESMGEEIVFEENVRNADGTVNVPITDLYKQSCRNIRITLEDKDGNVLSNREYKVPIMITTTQGTDGEAFLALQENLAMIETDANGNPTGNKTNLTLEQVKEICKTCDVVIRDNAILQKMADDAENDHPQVRDIYVYENSSLVVPNGTNYTINNLSLRRKEDAVASVSVYPEALKLPESAATPISLDFRMSAESWHWFTLPYDCNINEVTWIDGSPAQYNVDWFLMSYDGKKRAATQAGGCWKAFTGTTIKAGEGFIIAINGNINNPAHTYELRFPMSKEVLAAEGVDKTVNVRAWGVETNIRPNHKGWNLVGNPYLAYYQRNNITNFEGLRLGQLVGPDPQTGYWEQTGDVPYVVVPVGAGWIAYEQVLASETDLLPFTAYFVQVGKDGEHDSDDDLSISFDHTKSQLSATPMPASIIQRSASEVEEPVIVGVSLTNAQGESDKTSLVINNQFTDEYEMNADFFKWFGDYYKYYTKPVLYTLGADNGKRAFNALSEDLATQPISLGMYAAKAGDYTFSLDLRSDLSKVQEVWLYDATQDTYTNLLQDSYTFQTAKTESAGRFFLSVKMAPKVSTNLDNLTDGTIWATTQDHTILVNGLLSNAQLWIYDATGKLLHTDQTQYYQHSYSVPISGTYFVRVQNTMQTQTIKVVVE